MPLLLALESDGIGLTVATVVMKHPVGNEYVIVELPAAMAAMMPVDDPIVATAVLLLDQFPPVLPSVRVLEPVIQSEVVPETDAGSGFAVNEILLPVEQLPIEAVTVYTLIPEAVGVMVGVAQVVQESPVAPDTPVHV